jgi:hypothetical protein
MLPPIKLNCLNLNWHMECRTWGYYRDSPEAQRKASKINRLSRASWFLLADRCGTDDALFFAFPGRPFHVCPGYHLPNDICLLSYSDLIAMRHLWLHALAGPHAPGDNAPHWASGCN